MPIHTFNLVLGLGLIAAGWKSELPTSLNLLRFLAGLILTITGLSGVWEKLP